jgi:RimJ/RimL family protein N-acetyltransferase
VAEDALNRRAPETIVTARLQLRRPVAEDADAIFTTYASDPAVTRYVGWPRHIDVGQTRAFIDVSDAQWRDWPAGPYLIRLRDGVLVGGTGLAFDDRDRAQTGYVLATRVWGRGYATETLQAMVDLAKELGVRRLYAICHADHAASARVLEKCGFVREARLPRYAEFPNLVPGEPQDVLRYSTIGDFPGGTSEGNTA